MKKICMVAYTNYLSDARPRREAETLASRGDQVDFISLAEKNHPSSETVMGVRVLRVKQSRYRGSSGLQYGLSYLRFLLTVTWKLAWHFRRERYDIVYVHTMPDLLVFVGLIPKLFGTTLVLNLHDMMPELYMSKFGIAATHPLIRLLAFQEQFSIRCANKIICVHDPHRDILMKRGTSRDRITVLPNVPDPRIFRSDNQVATDDNAFRIVYHGTIAKRLGLDLAVRAFARAADRCPHARFEIYGTGDAADDVEREIESSGKQDRIRFNRNMFRVENIAQMIRGASVGLVPNRRDAATEYMLPVKLLEYVHLGIPVIAPRLMTIEYYFNSEIVEYYEPGNIEEMADAIVRLYSDPQRRALLALKGREFARVFAWEIFKQDLFSVIDGSRSSNHPSEERHKAIAC